MFKIRRQWEVWVEAMKASIEKSLRSPLIFARIVQKPQPTENRAKKVANRPLLIPRMVFENGELCDFNWKRMLRLARRRAKKHKRWFFMKGVTSRGTQVAGRARKVGAR